MTRLRKRILLVLAAAALLPAAGVEPTVRGVTRAVRQAQVGPLTEGNVAQVLVAEGDPVTSGQVLLALDDRTQQARIVLARSAAEAEGDIRQARAQAAEAAAQAARTAAAGRAGGAMEWELRQANARAAVAQAALDAALERQQLERRKLELELAQENAYQVRAPFDGVVYRLDVAVGAPLTRADRPVTVADITELEAVVYVPAALYGALTEKALYPARVLAPVDRAVTVRLRTVDMLMDSASARFRCMFTLANPDRTIPSGVEVEVLLTATATAAR